jgi:hypothetical protein
MKRIKRNKGDEMTIIRGKKNLSPRMKSLLYILSLLLIGVIIGIIISSISSPLVIEHIEHPFHHDPNHWKGENKSFFNLTDEMKNQIKSSYSIMVSILSINCTVLAGLIGVYIKTYQKTKSRYLIGFCVFIGVLLAKSIAFLISATPLLSEVVRAGPGFIGAMGGSFFGPFAIYFTIFEIIAMCILLYLSTE